MGHPHERLLVARAETTNAEWERAGMPISVDPFRCTALKCPAIGMDWYEAAEYANKLSVAHSPPLSECYELEGCVKDRGLVTCEAYASVPNCAGFPVAHQCRTAVPGQSRNQYSVLQR